MGVHGKNSITQSPSKSSSALKSVNPKKQIENIDKNLRNINQKSSSTSFTAAGVRLNASNANVDAMAPALTEPLSPTEKLSTTAASVSPTATTICNKKEDSQLESSGTATTSSCSSSPVNNNSNYREKRTQQRNIVPSTRVTRSKDIASAAAAVAVATIRESPTTTQSTRKLKRTSNDNDNELMGVSAATPSTTSPQQSNEKQNLATATDTDTTLSVASINNNNNNNIVCKDSATEQLLADLTNDFEETITAEICLRNQLPEVKVSTPDAAQLSSSDPEGDITVVKSPSRDSPEPIVTQTPATHMDSASSENESGKVQNDLENEKTENIAAEINTNTNHTDELVALEEGEEVKSKDETPVNSNVSDEVATSTSVADIPVLPCNVEAGIRLLGVEDLPPINSDSTMTASEEEETEELDALEARLSQLDGTAVTPITNDETSNTTLTPTTFPAASAGSSVVPSRTPPRTPTQQQATTPPTTSGLTSQQLLLTPTSSSSQMLALTPQSTSSLMREVNANVTGGGSELEDQDLEEVLKVLKGFDANAAGADNVLCDLNVLINEVYTTLNCEDIMSNPQQPNLLTSASTSATAALSVSAASTSTAKSATSPQKELQLEIEKKQLNMLRKIEFISRRLRKLQVRYMSKHTTEEIAGLFELTARFANKSTVNESFFGNDSLNQSVMSARPPAQSWEDEIKHPISASQMTNFLHRIETSANSQQLSTTTHGSGSPNYSAPTISAIQNLKKSKKLADLSTTSATSTACTTISADVERHKNNQIVPTLHPRIVDELSHVTGMMRAEMRDIQTAFDSDATESSSGAESADEMVAYNNQVQQSMSIVKRAAWRYCRDRATIASRWSWLQSQIADLEIKIRQHSELYQEVVRTKGAVVCEEELQRLANPRQESINAYGTENEENNALSGACRTRGYVPTHFRKRKLLQTTSLHTISKKAARPSTIKCGCEWPLNPCALCTGRHDPTAPRDLPDTMMMSERVALLDPGYHPVLSFAEDVNNSIHFEAIARTPSWQQRIVRIQPKSVARSVWKAEREAANSSGHSSRKYGDILLPTQKRRYIRRKDRNATSTTGGGVTDVTSSPSNISGGAEQSTTFNATSMPQTISSGTASSSSLAVGAGTVTGTGASMKSDGTLGTPGNGTGTSLFTSTTSTTPLVANRTALKSMAHSSRKMHCQQIADGVLLEPPSPSNNSNQLNDCTTPQNFDQYNPIQTHSSLISSQQQHRKGKHRKSMAQHQHHQQQQQHNNNNYNHQHNNYTNNNNINNNNTQYQQNYLNGDTNSDYWGDSVGGRSRTASPTHGIGSSSNYHKYERSLARRNRVSYDIDNIVIPYSVAAATRVEILPYKEIPTPKWRVFDEIVSTVEEENCDQDSNPSTDTVVKPTIEVKEEGMPAEKLIKSTTIPTENNVDNHQAVELNDQEKKEIVSNDTTKEANAKAESVEISKSSKEKIEMSNDVLKVEDEIEHTLITAEKQQEDISPKAPVCDKPTVEVNEDTTHQEYNTKNEDPPPPKKSKVEATQSETESEKVHRPSPEKHTTMTTTTFEMDDDSREVISITDLEENITDEEFVLRHERALNEERRKFQTFLKFPWSTRSRANRRIDSRAESSGANTPDPASPAPHTPSLGGGDQESIPSPLAPSTPLTPLDTINEATESSSTPSAFPQHSSTTIAPPVFPINNVGGSSKRNERRRTTSAKNQHLDRSERRSLTPDSREVPFVVPPYEALKFPLSDEAFDLLSCVTLLPPSVNSFYADDFKYQDDYHSSTIGGGNMKQSSTSRGSRRSSLRNEFAMQRSLSRSAAVNSSNCDVNGKKRRLNSIKRHGLVDNIGHKVAENSDDMKLLTYINERIATVGGQTSNTTTTKTGGTTTTTTTNSTDIDDDDFDYYDIDDDDDDGYPKHPLAPRNDIGGEFVVDDYEHAYMGGAGGGGNSNSLLGVSDTASSDTDPFEDEDPNDPEWRGESRTERHERLRKKS